MGADVRAHVGSSEDLAALVRRDEDVEAGAEGRLQGVGLQLRAGAHGGPHILDREVRRLGRAAHLNSRPRPLDHRATLRTYRQRTPLDQPSHMETKTTASMKVCPE